MLKRLSFAVSNKPLLGFAPLVLAAVLCLLSWCSLPCYYIPDTTAFLEETVHFGEPKAWHTTPPLYPMFLDAIGQTFPIQARMPAISAIQLTAAIFVPALCFILLGRRLKRPLTGWLAAIAATLYGPTYLLAHSTHTEPLFIGFVALSLLAIGNALISERHHTRLLWAFLAGSTAALATTDRTVGLALLALLPLATLLAPRPLASRIAIILLFLLASSLVLLAFSARNERVFGESSLVRGKGLHLWNRICFAHETFPDNPESRRVIEIAQRQGIANPSAENVGWQILPALVHQEGLSYEEADHLMATAARKAFLAHPVSTARDTTAAMAHAAGMNPPFNEFGVLFMAGGIRDEHFDPHLRSAEFWWKESLPKLAAGREAFPPYPPRAWLGSGPLALFEALTYAGNLWSGWWMLTIGACGLLWGAIRRDPLLLLGFGAALGLLGAATFGEMPQIRFWATSVPFFIFGFAALTMMKIEKDIGRNFSFPDD